MSELALAGNDALTVARHIDQIKNLGTTLVKSGLIPNSVRTPEAAVAIILKGRELGVPPMQALSHIHVINGKPSLSAELMMALVLQAGHEVWVAESTEKACTVKGIRRGTKREQSLTFTLAEAERAGVTKNATWKSYPAAMLRARAISAFLRMFAPDVLMGASYTPEELGADVDGDGNVIDVESRPTRSAAAAAEPAPAVPAALEPEAEGKPAEPPLSVDDFAEPVKPEPATIGKARAAAMSKALSGLGIGRKEHERFASEATGRKVTDLADLTDDEARMVWAEAKSMEAA